MLMQLSDEFCVRQAANILNNGQLQVYNNISNDHEGRRKNI